MTVISYQPPLSILIAALGGEGGGVLMNWIVDCAIAAGLPVQSTSVPGVAQRTGSTSYYIEIGKAGTKPVFALVPMPGRVDLVIASELSEAGRVMERGFVSPSRTTLIMSTSRVLTTAEKMQMGDGRFPSERIIAAGEALAQRLITFDLDTIARECGTIVSAPMFGALAGTGLLPFDRAACEAVMGKGRGAAASLAGFSRAYQAATGAVEAVAALPETPDILKLGQDRCADYMDQDYAALFTHRVEELRQSTASDDHIIAHALEEATRRLALWMTYEDIPRVADLKIRPERFARIRAEAQMSDDQVLTVTDILKPGIEEVAAMLPVSIGEGLLSYHRRGGKLPLLGSGINLKTTALHGALMFKLLAWMGRFRRSSLRYRDEDRAIVEWLGLMRIALSAAPAFAGALAEMPRLLKGYGETQVRGLTNYRAIMDQLVLPCVARGVSDHDAPALRQVMSAALADPEGSALAQALSSIRNAERAAA